MLGSRSRRLEFASGVLVALVGHGVVIFVLTGSPDGLPFLMRYVCGQVVLMVGCIVATIVRRGCVASGLAWGWALGIIGQIALFLLWLAFA